MQLTCPCCFARYAIEAALTDDAARRDKLTLPLTSHGYLFEIVAGGASRVEGKAEVQTEQQKRHRSHRDVQDAQVPRAQGRAGAAANTTTLQPAAKLATETVAAHLENLKGAVKP